MNKSYINYLKAAKKSERTINEYTNYIEKFLAFAGKPDTEVTSLDVCDYQASISHLSANSIRIQLAAIKSYYKFMVNNEIISKNPTEKVELPKVHAKVKKYMTAEDIEALIENCKTFRDVAIIKFMASTGVRISEMSNITLDEYYESINTDHEITIDGKGDKERNVYVNDSTQEAIDKYLSYRGRDNCEYLFASFRETQMDEESFSKTLKKIACRAGLSYWKEISPHWLRAAFATIANAKGYDVKTISEALGHSSIAVTNVYLKTTQGKVNETMASMSF